MESDFEAAVRTAFAEQLDDIERARDLYRALCNLRWQRTDHPEDIAALSWRMAGGLVADIRNQRFAGAEIQHDCCLNCGRPSGEHQEAVETIKFFDQSMEVRRELCPGRSGQGRNESFQPDSRGAEDYLDFYCSGGRGDRC